MTQESLTQLYGLGKPLIEAITDRIGQLQILAVIVGGTLSKLPNHTPAFIEAAYGQGNMLAVTPASLTRYPVVCTLVLNGVANVVVRCLDINTGALAYDIYSSSHEYVRSVYTATIDELALDIIELRCVEPADVCEVIPA